MRGAPRGADGVGRRVTRHLQQPPRQRPLRRCQLARLLRQHEEDRLRDVARQVRVPHLPPGGGVDDVDVPVHQPPKRLLATASARVFAAGVVVRLSFSAGRTIVHSARGHCRLPSDVSDNNFAYTSPVCRSYANPHFRRSRHVHRRRPRTATTHSPSNKSPCSAAGSGRRRKSPRGGDVYNPSTGQVIARVPLLHGRRGRTRSIEAAARRAARRGRTSRSSSACRVLFKFRELLVQHVRGDRPLRHARARQDARRGPGVGAARHRGGRVRLRHPQSCSWARRSRTSPASVDCETIRHPVGVCVGITPFNFPAMVPLWMFPVAIACGNTFVLKPSEKVPLSAVHARRAARRKPACPTACSTSCTATRSASTRCCTHPLVQAISFVGSTAIAKYVYETGTKQRQARAGRRRREEPPDHHARRRPRPGRRGAAGVGVRLRRRALHGRQRRGRRSATSRDRLVDALVETRRQDEGRPDRRRRRRGHGPGHQPRAHRDRVAGYLDIAKSEGADRRARRPQRSTAPATASCSARASSTASQPTCASPREEIFGPVLSVVRADDLDEALAIGRNVPTTATAPASSPASGYAARAVQAPLQRRHDRHQRRRARPDGVVPVHRLEQVASSATCTSRASKASSSTRSRR